jgi:tetratricopeptide (TPR) repeat protein
VTMLLAHPEAEDLGRFVEGTLVDPERAAIVQHIADCDDCRMSVVDAAEFIEPAKTESYNNWWMGIAASVILVAAIGTFVVWQRRDPSAELADAYSQLEFRPLEGRLRGFPYVRWKGVMRGPSDEADPEIMKLGEPVADVLEKRGDDATTLHAHGLAHLIVGERAAALVDLAAATRKTPNDAAYWSDLAAAEIANGDDQRALASADHALQLQPDLPDALFNRAIALKMTGDSRHAIEAYRRYVIVDPRSNWSVDAEREIKQLEGSFGVP